MIPKSGPDAELAGLWAELRKRYPTDDISIDRQIRADGTAHHLSISLNTFALNRRRSVSLSTDSAATALEWFDSWDEKMRAEHVDPPAHLTVHYCILCGEVLHAIARGLQADEYSPHDACKKCPESSWQTVERAVYVPVRG